MKRKVISVLLALILCAAWVSSAAAAPKPIDFVVDECDYLAYWERVERNELALSIYEGTGVGIFFVYTTEESAADYDVSRIVCGITDYVVMVENAEYWYLHTAGLGEIIDTTAEDALRAIYDDTATYAPSLKELFVQKLQGMILSGELPMGENLPSERELCQQMGVSRAVVNGGITELARQGFLEVRPRQGAYVADYRRDGNMETLMAIMDCNGGMLGKEEIRSILEVRWGLEQMTLHRVIDNASDGQLAQLGIFVNQLSEYPAPAQAAEIAFAFHHEMTLMGGNHILPLIYTSFKVPCTALWVRFCKKYGVAALYSNVEELYRHLLNRDKEGARNWSNVYLAEAINGTQQIYEA